MSRLSHTERRRASLARRVDTLDRLENRSMITESLGLMVMGIGLHTDALVGRLRPEEEHAQGLPAQPTSPKYASDVVPIHAARRTEGSAGSGQADVAQGPKVATEGDWITILRPGQDASSNQEPTLAWKLPKVAPPGGGGAAQAPRSGSSGSLPGTISPLRLAPPQTSSGINNPAVVAGPTAPPSAKSGSAVSARRSSTAAPLIAATGGSSSTALVGSGGALQPNMNGLIHLTAPSNGPADDVFEYFNMYSLDFNDGGVLFPGFVQYATPGGNVDLRAQVSGADVSSYSWNTSGIGSLATDISGTSSYDLTFMWDTDLVDASPTASITLTVTDTDSQQESQTYTFAIPSGTTGTAGTGTMSWPEVLSPDTVLAGDDSFASQNVSVDANSGTLDTSIALPTYNPNVPGLALTYDSQASAPQPIFIAHHELDPTQVTPSEVSAQLTFDGTAGTTYYYGTGTGDFNPGDVQQIALQANATSLATGRYSYSMAIGDIRTSTTTTTVSGTATVLNESGSAFGDGWTLSGLEQITSASGGVILNLGGGDKSLWFAGSFGSGGGTFTDPSGEFSTLTQNSGGGYTQTLTDGTQIDFNSGGQQIATVDTNGLHTTYSYSGGQLSTIQDPYNNLTTFTYSGGELTTITDPAGRIATFTHSGGDLTGVTLPDSSTWGYAYDSGGRLTQVTDPNSHTVTIAYDSAERVGTITQPDSSVETFQSYQESGWTDSGTSASPAAAILLAQSSANFTDPLGNETQLRPDWNGEGLTNQTVDPSDNVTTNDRDINGLATVMIDQDNDITQYTYDSLGNPTTITFPAGNTEHYTYNSFSEPLTFTNGDGNTTTYTYNSGGDNTVIEDALDNRTTMTYTADGMLATSEDARNNVTTYQYDSQDRLTTILYPDGSTNLFGYDNKGNQNSATDGNGYTTTFSFDALNRETGTTDALGNRTTYLYDAAGNEIAVEAPLGRTTSYAYDTMDRITTFTDPLDLTTVTAYDSGGNVISVTNPLGEVSSTSYNADEEPTVATDPLGHVTTTSYDAAGQTTAITDPLAGTTSYTYNADGYVTVEADPLGQLTTFVYSATDKLLQETDPNNSGGALYKYTYNADDERITATDPFNNVTTYTYDAVGNQIAVTDPNGHTTSYAYDSMNRQTTVTDPLGNVTVTGYDADGNAVTVKDPLGNVTTTQYDALDRATTVIDAVNGTTATEYDAAGRQAVVIDAEGNRTTYAYNADDRMTTLTTPLGTATYVYDIDGELTDTTDADGHRTTYTYNSDGEPTGESWLNSSGGIIRSITSTYDSNGNLIGVTDPSATLTFTYDANGNQLTAQTSSTAGQPNVTLTSTYNAANDVTSISDNLSSPMTVSYTYDSANRLTAIGQSIYGGGSNLTVGFGYDGDNNVTSITRDYPYMGGTLAVNSTLTYDADDRVTTVTDGAIAGMSGGGGVTPLATFVYGYDADSDLTSEHDAQGTVSFSYDDDSELTGASGSRAETYTYDSGGNRTMTGYTTGADNELTASPGATYSYDADGNMTGETLTSSGDVWTYTYDYSNRLTGATEKNSGGTVISQSTYTYDALNRRIGTDVNGAQMWTVYNGQNPWADFNVSSGGSGGSVTLATRYLDGPAIDEILARTNASGSSAWYLTDKLGSIRDIVSTSGTVLDQIAYDSYGNVTSESNPSNGDRFKYAGMQYDAATGLYFDNARYYNSSVGQFVSQDPKGFAAGDDDLYRYVGNGPTDATDPSGMDSGGNVGNFFAPQQSQGGAGAGAGAGAGGAGAANATVNLSTNNKWRSAYTQVQLDYSEITSRLISYKEQLTVFENLVTANGGKIYFSKWIDGEAKFTLKGNPGRTIKDGPIEVGIDLDIYFTYPAQQEAKKRIQKRYNNLTSDMKTIDNLMAKFESDLQTLGSSSTGRPTQADNAWANSAAPVVTEDNVLSLTLDWCFTPVAEQYPN